MFQAVDNFVQLRSRLQDVQEQEQGWVLATLDYDPKDADLKDLLVKLYDDGVVSEIRRNGIRIYAADLDQPGKLELRIDRGSLPGYFETYDGLIERHPDGQPDEYRVWLQNDEL